MERPLVLRQKEVAATLGISIPTLWRLRESDPVFPKAIQLSVRNIGFLRTEVEAYLAGRARIRVAQRPDAALAAQKGKVSQAAA